MQKRAQVSVEYIILIGVLLMITIPIFYYALNTSSQTIRLNQAEDVIESIVNAADNVYALGPGTKNYVWVHIPSGVQSFSIGGTDNKEFMLKLQIFSGVSDFHVDSKASLVASGDILNRLKTKGKRRVWIEALDTGEVQLS